MTLPAWPKIPRKGKLLTMYEHSSATVVFGRFDKKAEIILLVPFTGLTDYRIKQPRAAASQ